MSSNLIIVETALEHLAGDEANLRARVRDLERDVYTFREIASAAMQALADLTTEHTRQTQRYHHVLDEARQLGADVKQLRAQLATAERDLQICLRGRAA